MVQTKKLTQYALIAGATLLFLSAVPTLFAQQPASATHVVLVGGSNSQLGLLYDQYTPSTIVIRAGDTVVWKDVFGFQSEGAENIFAFLLKSFVDDHLKEEIPAESAGWRSLVEIATGIGASRTTLCSSEGSAQMKELVRKGVVERRTLTSQRGRGGRVTKVRIAYGEGFVKEYVDRYVG